MLQKVMVKCRTTEIDSLTKRVLRAYSQSEIDDADLAGICSTLRVLSKKMTQQIFHMKKEATLREFDAKRGATLGSIFHLVKGYIYSPFPAVKEAAKEVRKLLDRYGLEIRRESYTSESSLLNSLLTKLQALSDSVVEPLSGLHELITLLRADEDAFAHAALQMKYKKMHESSQKSATALKEELLQIINSRLIVYLRGLMVVKEEQYGPFVRLISQMIHDSNMVVKKRLRKAAQEKNASL